MELARPVPAGARRRTRRARRVASGAHTSVVGGLVERHRREVVHERGVGRERSRPPTRPIRVDRALEAVVRGGDVLAEHVESAHAGGARAHSASGPAKSCRTVCFCAAQAPHQRLSHSEIDASMGGRECQTRATIGAVTIDSLAAGLV